MTDQQEPIDGLSQKVIKVSSIVILMVLITLLILYGFKILLLIVAGLLFSIFFRGIAYRLREWFPINEVISLFLAFILFAAVIFTASTLLYPSVSKQMKSLQKEIPMAIEKGKTKLQGNMVGDFILKRSNKMLDGQSNMQEKVMGFFNSVFGVLGDMYVIFFLGMFFTAQPSIYRNAIVTLFPIPKREKAESVLLTIAYTLKRWLMGKLLSMFIVGVLTTVGLSFIGIPMALTLGIFAAIITFIPNFGPLLSFIPAGLLASVEGMDQLLYTALLYVGIQALESNLLDPMIQKRMISFPIAAILIAQVLLAVFTGALGVILAVPIVAIVMVLVKMLYIEDILKDKNVEVKGEEKFS